MIFDVKQKMIFWIRFFFHYMRFRDPPEIPSFAIFGFLITGFTVMYTYQSILAAIFFGIMLCVWIPELQTRYDESIEYVSRKKKIS